MWTSVLTSRDTDVVIFFTPYELCTKTILCTRCAGTLLWALGRRYGGIGSIWRNQKFFWLLRTVELECRPKERKSVTRRRRMESMLADTLRREMWWGSSTRRWQKETLAKSCKRPKLMERTNWRLPWGRFRSEHWSWERSLPTKRGRDLPCG